MYSVEPGIYTAPDQPDIIVLYGGELKDDPNHTGPWVQWRFPWETDDQFTSSLCFQFQAMLKAANYALQTALPSKGFQ